MAQAHATAPRRAAAGASSVPASPPPPVHHLPPKWTPKRVVPSLPLGVAILSVAVAAGGLILFLAGALIFLNLYFPQSVPSNLLILPTVDPLGAAILLLIGTVILGLANALWHQERWALWLTVGVLFAAAAYLFFTATITVLFLLVLVVFVYLLAVRQHFY